MQYSTTLSVVCYLVVLGQRVVIVRLQVCAQRQHITFRTQLGRCFFHQLEHMQKVLRHVMIFLQEQHQAYMFYMRSTETVSIYQQPTIDVFIFRGCGDVYYVQIQNTSA